jgi:hypothetical protein
MKRVVMIAALTAALFAWPAAHAQAIAEFCPANVFIKPVGVKPDDPAALYGFEIIAEGPRTVKTVVALDTNAGWFTVDVPSAALREKNRRYKGPSADFIRRDWVSDVMYVRFARPVVVAHSWVAVAKSSGDTMGWAEKGNVACPPYAAGNPSIKLPPANPALAFVTNDEDHVDAPPSGNALILPAVTSAALEKSDCSDPFENATITRQVSPDYPEVMRPTGVTATTAIEVAINPDGSLADAWIWGPSGYRPFDESSLAAARLSIYKAGRAYCQPAPGFYFFKVTFDPNQ